MTVGEYYDHSVLVTNEEVSVYGAIQNRDR